MAGRKSWNRVKLALWARSFRECEASSVPTNLAINEDHRNAGCIMLQDKISQGDLRAMAGVARRASAES